jgi:hypothetical protein
VGRVWAAAHVHSDLSCRSPPGHAAHPSVNIIKLAPHITKAATSRCGSRTLSFHPLLVSPLCTHTSSIHPPSPAPPRSVLRAQLDGYRQSRPSMTLGVLRKDPAQVVTTRRTVIAAEQCRAQWVALETHSRPGYIYHQFPPPPPQHPAALGCHRSQAQGHVRRVEASS